VRGGEDPPGPAVLEHLLIRPGDPADMALKAASFFTGLSGPVEDVVVSRRPAVLSGPRHIQLMLDGEVFKTKTPVEIRLIENAARFAAPAV
jgi:hypothetical protein